MKWLTKLLTSHSGLSSRRAIALLCVPPYLFGSIVGILSKEFSYFLTAMIGLFTLITSCFFFLTWQDVAEITKSLTKFNFKSTQEEGIITEISTTEEPTTPEKPLSL